MQFKVGQIVRVVSDGSKRTETRTTHPNVGRLAIVKNIKPSLTFPKTNIAECLPTDGRPWFPPDACEYRSFYEEELAHVNDGIAALFGVDQP